MVSSDRGIKAKCMIDQCSVLFCRFVCSDVKVRVECTRLVHKNRGNAEQNKNNRRLENDNNKNDERVLAAVVII